MAEQEKVCAAPSGFPSPVVINSTTHDMITKFNVVQIGLIVSNKSKP